MPVVGRGTITASHLFDEHARKSLCALARPRSWQCLLEERPVHSHTATGSTRLFRKGLQSWRRGPRNLSVRNAHDVGSFDASALRALKAPRKREMTRVGLFITWYHTYAKHHVGNVPNVSAIPDDNYPLSRRSPFFDRLQRPFNTENRPSYRTSVSGPDEVGRMTVTRVIRF